MKYRVIAVDFDGTIANIVPNQIGEVKPEAARVLQRYKEAGGKIIIWTCRTSDDAETVKKKLAAAGIEYDAFNDNLPNIIEAFPDNSRKVFADVYIDDRANFYGGEIDWNWVEEKLFEGVVDL